MKIFLIIAGLILLLSLVWFISAHRFSQAEGTTLNRHLISLSEKLLYDVKTEKPVKVIQDELVTYSVDDLSQGLINDNARKAFWINMYNAYYQILAQERKNKDGIFTRKSIDFADASFSLDDIEHGILRKYRWKYSLGYLPQFFPSAAIKKLAVRDIDYRIHFTLNCGAKSCPPIAFYSYENLTTQLDQAAQSFLENETTIDSENKELHVTKIMQWFKADFGGDSGIKQVVSKYLGGDYSSYSVSFHTYDWSEDLMNFAQAVTN